MELEHALAAAHSHLLKSKIAYLEGDHPKAVQHAMMAGDIATYMIFNKVGGVERIISSAEHKISELETILKPNKREVSGNEAGRN